MRKELAFDTILKRNVLKEKNRGYHPQTLIPTLSLLQGRYFFFGLVMWWGIWDSEWFCVRDDWNENEVEDILPTLLDWGQVFISKQC